MLLKLCMALWYYSTWTRSTIFPRPECSGQLFCRFAQLSAMLFVERISCGQRPGELGEDFGQQPIMQVDHRLTEGFLSSRQIPRTSCLITDVQMPGMTGLELHRRLLAAGKTIPTILITAYPDDSAREGALEDGVVCYPSKPFDENELLACIDKSLNT
jgi:CheY-like chemotaxis protein